MCAACMMLTACPQASGQTSSVQAEPATVSGASPPQWVHNSNSEQGKLCGVGVAGKSFDVNSPYPKEMSQERAVRNLAGALATAVEEAIIDNQINETINVDTARVLTVDPDLIDKVGSLAETTFWVDVDGTAPFAQKGFTYALSCVDMAEASTKLGVKSLALVRPKKAHGPSSPDVVPRWINRTGKQSGGRLCAVGFSLPMFYPEGTFEAVIEDIRSQLATVIETLVSNYYEEQTTEKIQNIQSMTVASTKAMSEGVVVTHFWYDRDGRGPNTQSRTTYGWGCMYPVEAMKKALAAQQPKSKPLDKATVAKVKEHAQAAFDQLDDEILKHGGAASASGKQPSRSEPPTPERR